MHNRLRAAALLAAVAASASSTGARADDPTPAATPANEVDVAASTALEPLAKAAGTRYGLQYTGIRVSVTPSDSSGALRALAGGSADIALVDRTPGNGPYLDHKFAVLPFAFVTNHADGVASLTAEQIAGLMTGKITNWRQAGGANLAVKIVSRGASSGVTALLEAKFLKGQKATAADSVATASGTAIDDVKNTPGAISAVPFAVARAANASVDLLAIEGASPDEAHVGDGSYPFWAYEHAVTNGAPTTQTSRFLSLLESNRTMLHGLGFIAVTELGPGALTP